MFTHPYRTVPSITCFLVTETRLGTQLSLNRSEWTHYQVWSYSVSGKKWYFFEVRWWMCSVGTWLLGHVLLLFFSLWLLLKWCGIMLLPVLMFPLCLGLFCSTTFWMESIFTLVCFEQGLFFLFKHVKFGYVFHTSCFRSGPQLFLKPSEVWMLFVGDGCTETLWELEWNESVKKGATWHNHETQGFIKRDGCWKRFSFSLQAYVQLFNFGLNLLSMCKIGINTKDGLIQQGIQMCQDLLLHLLFTWPPINLFTHTSWISCL